MNKHNIDYNKHCKYAFGAYVQAYQENEKKNDNKPCTIDCIYLEPEMNDSGGHIVMNLVTGAKMTKSCV